MANALTANPGFEVNTNNWSQSSGAVLTRVTSEQHSGAAALQVVCNGASSSQGTIYATPTTAAIGQRWFGTIWAKGAGVIKSRLSYRNDANVTTETVDGPPVTLTGSWQPVKVEGTAASGSTTRVHLWVLLSGSAQTVTFYLDDAWLERAELAGAVAGSGVYAADTFVVPGAWRSEVYGGPSVLAATRLYLPRLEGGETIAGYRYIYGKLAGIAGITGVWAGNAPRGSAMPYILVQAWPRPDGGDVSALGSERVMAKLRYLVKVVSPTLETAEPITRDLDTALRVSPYQSAQVSGYTILNPRRSEPFEMPTIEGDEQYWQTGGYYDLEVTAGV